MMFSERTGEQTPPENLLEKGLLQLLPFSLDVNIFPEISMRVRSKMPDYCIETNVVEQKKCFLKFKMRLYWPTGVKKRGKKGAGKAQ